MKHAIIDGFIHPLVHTWSSCFDQLLRHMCAAVYHSFHGYAYTADIFSQLLLTIECYVKPICILNTCRGYLICIRLSCFVYSHGLNNDSRTKVIPRFSSGCSFAEWSDHECQTAALQHSAAYDGACDWTESRGNIAEITHIKTCNNWRIRNSHRYTKKSQIM